MNRPHFDQDIRPLSQFRANVASFVQQVHKTHRPMIITNRGKSAAVLIDVADYESLLDQLELVQEVRDADREIERGEGVEHEIAKKQVLSRLKK
ncbi:MAG: type II toxin-antitoxin system Phd/YefM family antitoxin [Nitrospirota bacterium]